MVRELLCWWEACSCSCLELSWVCENTRPGSCGLATEASMQKASTRLEAFVRVFHPNHWLYLLVWRA